jgi:hypothetical protein
MVSFAPFMLPGFTGRRCAVSWPNRILIYLFPIPLWIVEYLIRLSLEGANAGEFFTPSLTAAALGLCLPVCLPKTFPTEKFEEMAGVRLPPGYVIRTRFDADLVPFAWMVAGLCFVVWASAVFVATGGTLGPMDLYFLPPWGPAIALIMYLLAVAMTELKERA